MFLDPSSISLMSAFIAGMLTFVAPCVLPILPAYIGFIAGEGVRDNGKQLPKSVLKRKTFIASLFFVSGFLLVFVSLGLSASTLGLLFIEYRRPIQLIGGGLFILLGMQLAGLFEISVLNKYVQIDAKKHLTRFPKLNAFIIGLSFGLAWSPCIGPILAVILFWASQSQTFWTGFWLLLSFGLGLGVPFLVLSLFTDSLMIVLRKKAQIFKVAQKSAGVLIIILGVLLLGDWLGIVVSSLQSFGNLELWLNEQLLS